MSEMDLAKALECELHRRGVAFDYGHLLEYVEEVWVEAKNQADINRWADELMDETALPVK